VTGSRDWADFAAIARALNAELEQSPNGLTVVHGDCPNGADRIADLWASTYPRRAVVTVERYPADWKKHGKPAGFIRNQQMVNRGADVCLAFPLGESRGTRHCMAAATKAGIPVINLGDR
jgi:hypothetical protein